MSSADKRLETRDKKPDRGIPVSIKDDIFTSPVIRNYFYLLHKRDTFKPITIYELRITELSLNPLHKRGMTQTLTPQNSSGISGAYRKHFLIFSVRKKLVFFYGFGTIFAYTSHNLLCALYYRQFEYYSQISN